MFEHVDIVFGCSKDTLTCFTSIEKVNVVGSTFPVEAQLKAIVKLIFGKFPKECQLIAIGKSIVIQSLPQTANHFQSVLEFLVVSGCAKEEEGASLAEEVAEVS